MPSALKKAPNGLGTAKLMEWWDRPDIMVRELFGATPDGWQDEALRAFPTNPRLAMKASKGPGKAQPKDTMIPTPDGLRRFGNLSVGDYVFAVDGSRTQVKAIYDRGVLPLYRITFDDHSSTLACGEHLWKVRGQAERVRKHAVPYQRHTSTKEIWAVLSTEEIIKRGVRVKNGQWSGRQFEIPMQGPAQFNGKQLILDPYVLGVWLGDGVRGAGKYATKPTHEIGEEIKARGFEISRVNDGIVTIYGIAGRLRTLGVLDKHSYNRSVPQEYLTASIRDREDLVRGLFDTDAGVDKDGHIQFASTSHQLAEDVIWLVRSLGGSAHMTKVKLPFYYDANRKKIMGRPCYRVVVRTPFNPFVVPQRKARWVDPAQSASTSRYMKRYIDKIEPEGTADCMCIEVDHPDELYLTNDFIVTHNTCLLAWLGWNFLLTRPHPNIAATSISADNLRDGLWKEMSHWYNKAPLLQEQFVITGERIFHKNHKDTWFMAARSWSKTANPDSLGNTLAGLHADYIAFLIDESGDMPVAIVAAAEAALSSCIEGHIIQAGNTNSLDGALYMACVKQAYLWKVVVISADPDDPARSTRVSLDWAKEMIKAYGRDSSFIKVMVLGEWPEASINALLGPADVEAAMKRMYQEWDIAANPRILGVDVASEGADASVIFPRQGLVAFKPHVMRSVRSPEGAAAVAGVWKNWDVNAVFIDNTGGFGAGWIDQLRILNYQPIGVGFAESAEAKGLFYNRRAEMYFRAAEWIKGGGCLPNDPDLVAELTQTTYTHKGDRLILEPKDMIKAKIGRSPDKADALALTFAATVAPRVVVPTIAPRSRGEEYDPFESMMRVN